MSKYFKRILRSDRNKMFKGHTLNMVQSDTEINIHQSYFQNIVHNNYNVNEHYSTITTTIYPLSKVPKWMIDLNDRLKNLFLPEIMEVEWDDYILKVYPAQIALTHKIEEHGLRFTDQFDNINQIKKCNERYKVIRKNLKTMCDEELLSCEIKREGESYKILLLPEDIFYR